MSKTFDESASPMEALFHSFRSARFAEQLEGRRLFPIKAIVVNNKDPEARRRIKIADPALGGQIESNWLRPVRFTQNQDPPLPQINQTVMVLYADGDPEDGYYIPLMNDANPSRVKNDAELDESYEIEGSRETIIGQDDKTKVKGDRSSEISGDEKLNISGDKTTNITGNLNTEVTGKEDRIIDQSLNIFVGQSIKFLTDSGAFLELSATGNVVLQDAFGRKIRLGGSGINSQWDLNGGSLNIVNASSVTIQNKEIATLGATDTRGDSLITKGW